MPRGREGGKEREGGLAFVGIPGIPCRTSRISDVRRAKPLSPPSARFEGHAGHEEEEPLNIHDWQP